MTLLNWLHLNKGLCNGGHTVVAVVETVTVLGASAAPNKRHEPSQSPLKGDLWKLAWSTHFLTRSIGVSRRGLRYVIASGWIYIFMETSI